jgi:hypothetical protein
MRNVPDLNDEYDIESLADLKAEPWMLDLLKLNPEYTCWGPHEDYMWKDGHGWDRRILNDSWSAFEITLDDLNECANFYFEVVRDATPCEHCDSSGYNPETKQLFDDLYDYAKTGRRWIDRITQDEVDALVAHDRLRKYDKDQNIWVQVPRTADEVNAANNPGASSFGDICHDGINQNILVETRARRLGVWGTCEHCHGEGSIYTEEKAHVNLVLCILHLRKGCSRGVEVKNIHQEDLHAVFAWLRTAAERNAQRFSKVTACPAEVARQKYFSEL